MKYTRNMSKLLLLLLTSSILFACTDTEQPSEQTDGEIEFEEDDVAVSELPDVEIADVHLFSFKDPKTDLDGYINKEGDIYIPPQYNQAFDFSDGLGKVSSWIDGVAKTGFINENGNFAIEPIYDHAESFSDGLAAVSIFREQQLTGFINTKGELVIEMEGVFQVIDNLSEGVAKVFYSSPEDYTMGFVNKEGEVIVPPTYNVASMKFSDGLGFFADDEKQYYFDYAGNIVLEFDRDILACPFTGGLACMKGDNEKWGYMNKQAEMIIEPQYESAQPFSEGLALIKLNQKWGFINQKGLQVIAPQFDLASSFSEGIAWVEVDGKWGAINREGELVIEPQFEFTLPFEGGLARVFINDKEAFINREGTIVFAIE
ncbi:WG repeat-containing protein [Bacillus sp. FJAT-45350]|uniref:WG repeat-containing protein n=1 Tax=Bacillus sp. FJAT-45350 TaxID=2011014 RepID=UPI000BB81684|nr:WG repeat-containing protein [Bacillus sp. FJAT-45350]